MTLDDLCESTTDSTASPADERTPQADAMPGGSTICVVVAPLAMACDVPTETEWSAFMGLSSAPRPTLH